MNDSSAGKYCGNTNYKHHGLDLATYHHLGLWLGSTRDIQVARTMITGSGQLGMSWKVTRRPEIYLLGFLQWSTMVDGLMASHHG